MHRYMSQMDKLGLLLPITTLIILYAAVATTAQPLPSFKCLTNNATCVALAGYVASNTTMLAYIQSLFQVQTLSSLLGVNLLPPTTPANYTVFRNQTIKVPFPCRCMNNTGVSDRVPLYTIAPDDTFYYIATSIFSGLVATNGTSAGLVDYQQIEAVNPIDPANLTIGTKVWIPLPCSCDDVEGQSVVHYAHEIAPGSSLEQIAEEFGTSAETLATLNNIDDPLKLQADQVIDVPLKGQVLQNLATPSKADGAAMKKLASALGPISGWSGSDFCIWSGVVCNNNGFVTSISLPSQNLSGSVPSVLNTLSHLTSISLQNNHLSGPLPTFVNHKLLQEIHLDSNKFTSVPYGAFTGLSHLQILSLDNNPNLSPWTFPAELMNSPILAEMYARNTNLKGKLPDIFSSLTSLQNLRLSHNNLTGELPGSLHGTQIENLWLENQHMGLSGTLDVLSGMTFLKQVWLFKNKFTGPIPDLSKSPGVFDLQLQNNLLTGILPVTLMSLPKLANISLQNNKFQGPLPVFPESVTVTLGTNMFCKETPGNCNSQVSTLLEIAGAVNFPLKVAEAWAGNDACNNWKYLTCDASGNVISINLSHQGFTGTISPALANLTFLRDLSLDHNNLTGTIPESLTTLPRLKTIDVSNNNLAGPFPVFQSSVAVNTAGNSIVSGKHNSTATPVSRTSFPKGAKIILGVLVPTFIAALVMIVVHAYRKRRHEAEHLKNVEKYGSFWELTSGSPMRFTYHALKMATNNFDMDRKLGGGGFGAVFEGTLNDGTTIAVKRLDHSGQGMKEFVAEVQTIGSIHHVNLVKLVGFCAEKSHRLLAYERMSNGSLDKWIFNSNSRDTLPWDTKKKIILQIAKGLAYLHEGCQKRIAHLDIKPQNVLLDEDFNAKLSDFGLAKLIDKDQSYVVTQMRGTRGYLAPEWLGRQITEKVDVYSYGVVMLEILFGRKSLDLSKPDESNILLHWVKKKADASEWSDLFENCSEYMEQNCEKMEEMVKLALWCLHTEPTRRPSMSMIVKVLEGATIPDVSNDFFVTVLTANKNLTSEATSQVSASILSGPR